MKYSSSKAKAIIGKPDMRTELSSDIVRHHIPVMTGAMGENFLGKTYHFTSMLENRFGSTLSEVKSKELNTLEESDIVQQMEPWPSKDAVVVQDDVVFVKFSE